MKRLFAPFRRWFKPQSKLKIREVDTTELRLEQWRTTPELMTESMKLSQSPTFRLMMAVMRNESPVNLAVPVLGPKADDRAAHLHEIQGYHKALNNLEAFTRPPDKEIEQIEPDFGTEDQTQPK